MTLWNPALLDRPGTKVEALHSALVDAVRDGRLRPGERLPSHRDLARRLGVAPGTVTAAYRRARLTGLIAGEVGRGSFVRHVPPMALDRLPPGERDATLVDLYQNFPLALPELENAAWAETLHALQRETDLAGLLRGGLDDQARCHREAGAAWFVRLGLELAPGRILGTPSFESALASILATILRPGDEVAVAQLGHPMVAEVTRSLSLRTRGVEIDGQGVVPSAVERAFVQGSRAVLCLPTFQTPTAGVMSERRRRSLARAARRHDAYVVEVEANAFLLETPPPPIARFAPERTFLVGDPRYAVSMGLHAHYLAVPDELAGAVAHASLGLAGAAPRLQAEVARRWFASSVAGELIAARRRELESRNALLSEVLGAARLRSHPASHHAWLELPRGVRTEALSATTQRRGVAFTEASYFALPSTAVPEAARICLGNAPDRETLAGALTVLRDAIDELRRGAALR